MLVNKPCSMLILTTGSIMENVHLRKEIIFICRRFSGQMASKLIFSKIKNSSFLRPCHPFIVIASAFFFKLGQFGRFQKS